MFINIDEAINYVVNRRKGDLSFDDFRDICHELGDKQDSFYTIHVTGTNGKGSTIAYLRDLLLSQGYKVGTFSSPHYLTHLDRIRINNNNIPENTFLRLLNKNLNTIEKYHLGMFEIDFLIMCDYFIEEKVDFAIVEVGIGGRLDSTNVINNTKLSIISTVGLDHTDKLGDTKELITKEKAGIIKNNSNVLVGYLEDNLKEIVKEEANKKISKYYECHNYQEISDRTFIYDEEIYEINSLAKYQYDNASLALEAFHIISKIYPFEINISKAKEYLKNSIWKGRFDIVKENPKVIVDGAHNPHAIKALMESFDPLIGSKCIIFAALKRKDYVSMINELNKHCDELVLTSFEHHEIYDTSSINLKTTINLDYKDAIKKAINKYDNILIVGSLYFVSEVMEKVNFNER